MLLRLCYLQIFSLFFWQKSLESLDKIGGEFWQNRRGVDTGRQIYPAAFAAQN